jgi:hypothetical protein
MMMMMMLEIPIDKDYHFLILVTEHPSPAHGTQVFHGSVAKNHCYK